MARNPVSVPQGRVDFRPADASRSEFAAVLNSRSDRDLDANLTRLLNLPPPERTPPKVSKADQRPDGSAR
jgi:hypothetical protein